MKRFIFASLLVLCALTIFVQPASQAVKDGPSANGSFQFTLEDSNTRYIEFDARMHGNEARGTMSFSDPKAIIGDPDSPDASIGAAVTANFDCFKIDNNRAVMGGVISTSNIAAIVGSRILLVVEDNGEGINAPATDRLTWGVYESSATGWLPVDAERDDDIGATLRWIATDAERSDDAGIPSHGDPQVRCDSFPLSSYSFVNIPHGSGNLQVKP